MLKRQVHDEVALVCDSIGSVSIAFTERTGGVSRPPYASLNLGTHVGDDPGAVAENRRRVLAALGAAEALDRLLVPNQVHGDRVVTVTSASPEALDDARTQIAEGADAIVCTAPGVPVMLCYADCVPVVLACPVGFAVIHSGWKGTYARIAAKAADALVAATGVAPSDIRAYIGPHIRGDEYEVSHDLMERFAQRFSGIDPAESLLDLARCIRQALVEAGVAPDAIEDAGLSTVRMNDRFFSYRAEGGVCGRHAAVAFMGGADMRAM